MIIVFCDSVINLHLQSDSWSQTIHSISSARSHMSGKEAYGRQKTKFFAQLHLLKLASTNINLFSVEIQSRLAVRLFSSNQFFEENLSLLWLLKNLYISSSVSFLYFQLQMIDRISPFINTQDLPFDLSIILLRSDLLLIK